MSNSFGTPVASLLLAERPGAPSSVLAPNSKARSPDRTVLAQLNVSGGAGGDDLEEAKARYQSRQASQAWGDRQVLLHHCSESLLEKFSV